MRKNNSTAVIFTSIVSLLLFYLANRLVGLYQILQGDPISKISNSMEGILTNIKAKPIFLYTDKLSLLLGGISIVFVWLVYLYNMFGSKKYMQGIEHGSAEWGNKSDISNFIDKIKEQNIILTETESLSMSSRMKRTSEDDFNRNKNVLIIGGAGSGKTRFYMKPNICQMHSSYVITDPKGSLLSECGKMLLDNGYKIKVFNLINRSESDKYNPFHYLKTEDDVLKLIKNIIANTNAPQSKSGGDFWEKSEEALLMAVFGYLSFEALPEDRTIGSALYCSVCTSLLE